MCCYGVLMRTTVTLDPDVVEQLKALAQRRNVSFKVALNDAVRAGLTAEGGGSRPFKVKPRPLGRGPARGPYTRARLAYELEDEEIIRKLELRK